MDAYTNNTSGPIELHLLQGCCREAERADLVAVGLEQLRVTLPEAFHGHLVALTEEVRGCSNLLRDLADRSQVHISRVPIVLNYLNVVLPCLCRSLRDITTHYEDKTLSREIRWRKMYHKMTEEAGGLPLPQRFVLYNHFLSLLKQLLTRYHPHFQLFMKTYINTILILPRSPSFDLNTLETLRTRLLTLREQRGIRQYHIISNLDKNTS